MEMKCPYFKECGGCSYLDISYQDEINKKKQYINKLFKSINYKKEIDVIPNDNPYFYRNKVIMAYKVSRTGKVICGIYEEGTPEEIFTSPRHPRTQDFLAKVL